MTLLAKWVKVSLLGLGVVSVVACSPMRKGGADEPGGSIVGADNSSAQTYAMQGQRAYQGQVRKNQYGEIINPLVAPANQTYYFAFDNSSIRPEDKKAMNIQANYLATHPKAKVRLEGNADNRGSREYNIGLGWRRDQSVARVLEQDGVMPKQLDMVSYGKERPAVIGDNERAWRLNRRVHLVYEAY
jgi:peptidoglycan-associated lipoprotein